MAFGIQIRNANTEIVIDSDYRNHAVVETGSVSRGAAGAFTISFASSYPSSTRQPLLFANPASAHVGQINWTYDGNGNINGASLAANGALDFNWKLLATPAGASADTYGLRVFDAAGARVFDAGLPYLQVTDAVSTGTLPGVGGSATYNHASTANPFYCLSSGLSRMGYIEFSTRFFNCAGWKYVSNTQVGFNWVLFATAGGGGGGAYVFPPSVKLLIAK